MYKVGDKVVMLKSLRGHQFPVGTVVEIISASKKPNFHGQYMYSGRSDAGWSWAFEDDECKPYLIKDMVNKDMKRFLDATY